ncbi:MAG: PepSY domain-containing protein [Gemmatimonadetes bacterium]|nr:PepSY domain-containing protein [Gemmatimonadota bacterium]
MQFRYALAIAALLSGALAAGASAQQPQKQSTVAAKPAATAPAQGKAHASHATATSHAPSITEAKPGLLKQATVTPEAARATAEKEVQGRLVRQRIEERGGKLVYAFWIRPAKATHSTTVLVDAKTGQVVK